MEIQVKNAPVMEYDAIVIPFSNEKTLTAPVPSAVKEPVEAALAAGYQGAILYSSDYLDADQTAQSVEKAMAVFGK